MTKKQILISTPSIQLNQLLKLAGVVGSGGEAKMLIRDEQVKVDGEVETRNKRQLVVGQAVTVGGETYEVV
jgi:ribosome-associated protein